MDNGEIKLQTVKERNTIAFEQAIRDTNKKLHEVMEVVALQQNAIGTLLTRMAELEQKINIQKVQLMGLGPSVKSE